MKKQIVHIATELKLGLLTSKQAKEQLLLLFGVSGSLDLDSSEKRLDEAVSKETSESLREWVKK